MKFADLFTKLGKFAREHWEKFRDSPKEEKTKKEPYYTTDKFWLYRWIMDFRYKRVGLTTITYLGPEYGYRRDIERIPKSQLDIMRRSQPSPVHLSGHGWNEWCLYRDESVTPFPVVHEEGAEYCNPTAVDLHLYMVNKCLDSALTFRKKTDIPIDGKMLAAVIGGICVLVFFMLGMFS